MKRSSIKKGILNYLLDRCCSSTVRRSKMIAADFEYPFWSATNARIEGEYWRGSKIYTIHAEERLLAKMRRPIRKVIVVRRMADGTAGNSRPCERCMHLLKEASVSCVVYKDGMSWFEEKL